MYSFSQRMERGVTFQPHRRDGGVQGCSRTFEIGEAQLKWALESSKNGGGGKYTFT